MKKVVESPSKLNTMFTKPIITVRISIKLILTIAAMLLVVWIGWWFRYQWMMKMGGAAGQSSPYYQLVPDECKKYISLGIGSGNTIGFLDWYKDRYRVRQFDIHFLPGPGKFRQCIGFAILTGSHADPSSAGDFTEIYVDSIGNPVVEVRVKYHQNIADAIARSPK